VFSLRRKKWKFLQSLVDGVISRKCLAWNECGRKWFVGVAARKMQEFAKTGNARIHVLFGNRQLRHSHLARRTLLLSLEFTSPPFTARKYKKSIFLPNREKKY
jgi:hypothetical protein